MGLINQATTERLYDEQNAPLTHTGIWSDYDEIATDYDAIRSPVDGDEKVGLLRILHGLHDSLGDHLTVLDIGCGTGAVLDLGITTPDRYTGIDPSQAMLNELLIKYDRKHLREIIAGRAEDVLPALAGRTFDLVIAAFGSASYVGSATFQALWALSSGASVAMHYSDGYLPSYSTAGARSSSAVDGSTRRVGKFSVTVTRA